MTLAETAAFALTEHKEHTNMKPKDTICLWFDKEAHEAARFYAATFPDSEVTAGTARPFPSRSPRTLRKRRTATGTRSSAMAARRVSAVGARTAGASPGRSPRAC